MVENFNRYSWLIVLLRDIHEGYLPLKDANIEQITIGNKF